MVKTLTRHGNSLALVLDKPILELLNIDGDTPLHISTDGRSLVISPVPDEKEYGGEPTVRDMGLRRLLPPY